MAMEEEWPSRKRQHTSTYKRAHRSILSRAIIAVYAIGAATIVNYGFNQVSQIHSWQ